VKFYLGTHATVWLAHAAVPLCVSHRRLKCRKALPRAAEAWILDSGGFSELSLAGRWETTAASYAGAAERYQREIGRLEWAAPQDWMCEPFVLERTGLTVAEHQTRTTGSFLQLCDLAPGVPWAPVLQGWARDDYLRHVEAYTRAGVDLRLAPVVGLGSVCRRQATAEIGRIAYDLAVTGVRLHGFGVKASGLQRYAGALASADSLAWSYAARRSSPLPGCPHKNCANCLRYALAWRARVVGLVEAKQAQGTLFAGSA